jgi:hypothetical protein
MCQLSRSTYKQVWGKHSAIRANEIQLGNAEYQCNYYYEHNILAHFHKTGFFLELRFAAVETSNTIRLPNQNFSNKVSFCPLKS